MKYGRDGPKRALTVLLCCLLLLTIAPAGAMAAEDAEHPLVSADSAPMTVDYAVNSPLEWSYSAGNSDADHDAYIAGNSGSNEANVSNISFTVTGAGTFTFDYMTDTYDSNQYALYYRFGDPLTGANRNSTCLNWETKEQFRGVQPWTHVEVPVTEADLTNGRATIYIAYFRGGTLTGGTNTVAIANVCFTGGSKNIDLDYDDRYGGVTALANGEPAEIIGADNPFPSGTSIALTAAATQGNRFYGWIYDGRFVGTDAALTFNLAADATVQAVFAPVGHYAARCSTTFYTAEQGGLAQALTDAGRNDDVVMLENSTISANTTIPVSVTLYVPYDETWNAYGQYEDNESYLTSKILATSEQTYRTLTIANGATLTVNGKLLIGGVTGYPGQFYQGHTSGAHGRVTNNGTIAVTSNGILDCWGFVDGAGSVTTESGSKVYEPFIVYDFAGGSNTEQLYYADQSPFKQYTMQNITCELTINYGAVLYGYCNLFAMGNYQHTTAPIIGKAAEKGLILISQGGSLTRTVDKTKTLTNSIANSDFHGSDLGRVRYAMSGGATLSYMEMQISLVTISTKDVAFPIPYGYEYVMSGGSYYIPDGIKIMPGAEMTVSSGAELVVSGQFYVPDGLKQSDMSGKSYPTTTQLLQAGFPTGGVLKVNGALTVTAGGSFGGVVQSGASGGRVTVEAGANVTNSDVQDGAKAAYDDNTAVFDLPGRVMLYDADSESYTLTDLTVGTSYTSVGGYAWTLPDYTMKSYAVNVSNPGNQEITGDALAALGVLNEDYSLITYASGDRTVYVYHTFTKNETVATNRSMTGAFVEGVVESPATINSLTVYDASDATRAAVSTPVFDGDGGVTFTVTPTAAGAGYTFLVQYTQAMSAPVTLTPADGVYTISGVTGDLTITVTGVKLGDVNGDTYVDSSDALKVLYYSTGRETPTAIQELAADVNRDGYRDSTDALQVLYYSTGRITTFD